MNKISFPALLLVLIAITINVFSQEWKWRDKGGMWRYKDYYNLELRLMQQTDYDNHKFNDKVDFRKSEFDSKVTFYNTKFDSTADFTRARFDGIADFTRARFDSKVTFYNTKFDSEVNFGAANFASLADFTGAKFASLADFTGTWFFGIADFTGVRFDSLADFKGTKFDSLADFKGTKFDAKVSFFLTVLPKYFDFSYIREIPIEIEFIRTLDNPDYDICYINLMGSSIDKIRFRYRRFKLWFPKDDFIGYELKASVYEELLKKQKDEGFIKSYKILDKEYREFQYTDRESEYNWLWGRVLNWVDKNWWGYGYDKELVIRNVILIYLLLSLINAFMLKHLTVNVYIADKINEWRNETQGLKSSKFFKSLPFSMFYTAQIFFGFKFDVEKLKYKENLQGWKIFNLIYFFTIYLGGFVCLAYLMNYIITV